MQIPQKEMKNKQARQEGVGGDPMCFEIFEEI